MGSPKHAQSFSRTKRFQFWLKFDTWPLNSWKGSRGLISVIGRWDLAESNAGGIRLYQADDLLCGIFTQNTPLSMPKLPRSQSHQRDGDKGTLDRSVVTGESLGSDGPPSWPPNVRKMTFDQRISGVPYVQTRIWLGYDWNITSQTPARQTSKMEIDNLVKIRKWGASPTVQWFLSINQAHRAFDRRIIDEDLTLFQVPNGSVSTGWISFQHLLAIFSICLAMLMGTTMIGH